MMQVSYRHSYPARGRQQVVSLIVTSLVFSGASLDDEAEALAKARAFRELAATAIGTFSNQYTPAFALKSTDHSADRYVFEFVDGGVRLRRTDHMIVGFSFSPPDQAGPLDQWDEVNAIGDAAAVSLAEKYIVAAGEHRHCELKHFSRDPWWGHEAVYVMSYVPTYQNIIYHPSSRITVAIDYHTGRLVHLSRDANLPNAPASVLCRISKETALFILLQYIFERYDVSMLELEFAELVITGMYRHPKAEAEHSYPQRVIELIGTNDSTLVYMFSFNEPSLGRTYKDWRSAFEGYVDPVTGTVWSVYRMFPFGGGQTMLLLWDLGIGETSVSDGKKTITVPNSDVDRIPPPRMFKPSARLILRRVRVVVVIEYDRSTVLVRTSLGDNHSYGRPSDNLKRALDQLSR